MIHLGKDIVHLGEKIQDEEEVIDDIVVKDINKVEEFEFITAISKQ